MFVIHDNAVGHYEMNDASPARVIPPYGSEVQLLEAEEKWAKISILGKTAWMLFEHLDARPPPEKKTPKSVLGGYIYGSSQILSAQDKKDLGDGQLGQVYFGPRGGRYVINRNGFRRYF
ncbi:MAG: hypothetical protein KDE55_07270 [Novosphingobium sp.]|nr:hypothetical protein [Novosphingobium sp.]